MNFLATIIKHDRGVEVTDKNRREMMDGSYTKKRQQ
jgi:hypothetical protein